jgi:hypothetical protein
MPSAPSDWTPPSAKIEKGEPAFKNVDNPGKWAHLKHAHHSLPAGARPLQANQEGKRMVDGCWEFHCDNWISEAAGNEKSQSGPTNMAEVPECRKGQLDRHLLKQMKLTQKRMIEGENLVFLQLSLPIGDTKKSGVENDPRLPCHSEVERATSIGLGGSHGNCFKEAMLEAPPF